MQYTEASAADVATLMIWDPLVAGVGGGGVGLAQGRIWGINFTGARSQISSARQLLPKLLLSCP